MKKLLIIAFVWPEPNSTAAGGRMLQLLHFFLEQGYTITVASTAAKSEYSLDLNSLGVLSEKIQLNHPSFDAFLTTLNPKIVLFDRFVTEEQFGWRVAMHTPSAIRILDTEDLHSLRIAREKAHKVSIPFTTDLWLQNDTTKREIASIYRSDLSLIISSFEIKLLTEVLHVNKNLLLHLPFLIEPVSVAQIKSIPTFKDRLNFMCISNGKHAPNIDALVWLKKEIWPLIRYQLPKANVHIYGAYLPEHIKQMHSPKQGFLICGWAENKNEVFQKTRINLAPLRFGAGIKGKLIDAMQTGTPSITTKIGAEGMHDELPWSGIIEETSKLFAQAAVNLYTNEVAWLQAQQNGFNIINQIYKKTRLYKTLANKLNHVQKNLKAHRLENFTGAMLQHQTMASTKYMSKWIELKESM